MASPQVEKGFTRIANDLLEAICRVDIPARELRVFLAIIRQTYGWKRKSAELTAPLLMKLAGISGRANITHLTNSLQARNMITKTSIWGRPTCYAINKDYDTWTITSSGSTVSADSTADPDIVSSVVNDTSIEANSSVNGDSGSTVSADNSSTVEADTTSGADTLLHERHAKERERKHGSRGSTVHPASDLPPDNDNGAGPVLAILRMVKGYPYDVSKDQEFVGNLKADYPLVDLVEVAKSYRDWVLDHPITKKDSPRSRFRNFVKKDDQWRKEHEAKCNERTNAKGQRPTGSGQRIPVGTDMQQYEEIVLR